MIKIFTRFLDVNGSDKFNIPLARRDVKYNLINIHIDLLTDNGRLRENASEKISIEIDQIKILDNVVTGAVTGDVANIEFNQEIDAVTDIVISAERLANIVPNFVIGKIAVTFFIEYKSDVKKKALDEKDF